MFAAPDRRLVSTSRLRRGQLPAPLEWEVKEPGASFARWPPAKRVPPTREGYARGRAVQQIPAPRGQLRQIAVPERWSTPGATSTGDPACTRGQPKKAVRRPPKGDITEGRSAESLKAMISYARRSTGEYRDRPDHPVIVGPDRSATPKISTSWRSAVAILHTPRAYQETMRPTGEEVLRRLASVSGILRPTSPARSSGSRVGRAPEASPAAQATATTSRCSPGHRGAGAVLRHRSPARADTSTRRGAVGQRPAATSRGDRRVPGLGRGAPGRRGWRARTTTCASSQGPHEGQMDVPAMDEAQLEYTPEPAGRAMRPRERRPPAGGHADSGYLARAATSTSHAGVLGSHMRSRTSGTVIPIIRLPRCRSRREG